MACRATALFALVGALVCVGATLATLSSLAGWTPTPIYGALGDLQLLSTLRTWAGLPWEMWAGLWFITVLMVCRLAKSTLSGSWTVYVLPMSVLGTGLTTLLAFKFRGMSWAIIGIAAMGLGVLIAASLMPFPHRKVAKDEFRHGMDVVRAGWRRAAASLLAIVVLGIENAAVAPDEKPFQRS